MLGHQVIFVKHIMQQTNKQKNPLIFTSKKKQKYPDASEI